MGKAPGIGFDHSPPSGIEVVGRTPITMAVYRDRVTGVAACHGLEVTEIESRWQARISAPFRRSLGLHHHQTPVQRVRGVFPGIKWPGPDDNHLSTSPSRAEIKEKVQLYLYSPSVRDELIYLAPLGSENISAPYFRQCFFQGGLLPPR